jgi:cysteine synthase B
VYPLPAAAASRALTHSHLHIHPPARPTGPEIWRQTDGRVTHLVSSMGTFGTVMGGGRYLKEKNPEVQVVGLQPSEAVQIPGIRRWK